MEEIIKTTLLEHEKSSFLLDLIKHTNGSLYINIRQTIHKDSGNKQAEIKINPAALYEILDVLNNYSRKIPPPPKPKEEYMSGMKKTEIEKRYLKGVSIKDLALQFNCTTSQIERILENDHITVIKTSQVKPPGEEKKTKQNKKWRKWKA